jgi:glycosyltransferase involved in cell wall biosynthesis
VSVRRRVLVAQRSLQPPGGGHAIAAWIVEALKDAHDVTVCTQVPVDFAAVNRFYGTAIRPREVAVVRAPSALARLLEPLPLPLALLKTALFWRRLPSLLGPHDVLISGSNEVDFGRPGIQYVHYPWNLRPRPDRRWYHLGVLLRPYYRLCDGLAGFSADGARLNLTLVNSDWTGALVRRRYGVETRTVYPPGTAAPAALPWAARQDGFVCIGRLVPDKQVERVIDIVARVRETAPDVRLHIVGTFDAHPLYGRRIRRQVRAHASWITLHEDLPRAELLRLLGSQRYGIHGMRQEHFGIAAAEMVSAGAIVFVPADGGQVEIVGGDERLLYRTSEEAVARIRRVLGDPAEQARLRTALAARGELFSVERFVRAIREIVAAFPCGPPVVSPAGRE